MIKASGYRKHVACWATVIGLGGAACASEPPVALEGLPQVTVTLSERQKAELPRLTLEVVAEACQDSGNTGECELATNADLIAGVDSTLLAYDFDRGLLRAIYGSPATVHAIGRKGEGPGEYQMMYAASPTADGGVAGFDPALRRIVRFDANGKGTSVLPVSLPDGFITGGMVGADFRVIGTASGAGHGDGDSASVQMFKFDVDGKAASIATLPVRRPVFGMEQMRPPRAIFEAEPVWQVRPNGHILYASTERYSVSLFDSTGKYLLKIDSPVPPRAVTNGEFEREFESLVARAGKGPMGAAIRAQAGRRIPNHAAITWAR